MLTKAPHLFDDATRITAGDSSWQGCAGEDYWAFVGQFGGATAATILRALIDHPQRAGDPLALTVNYCAPVAQGEFDLDIRLVKANRSSQHWSVEMTQGRAGVVTLATAVFAERRPSWSHQPAAFPQATPFEQTLPYPAKIAAPWVKQYDFRFVEGEPKFGSSSPVRAGQRTLQSVDRRPRAAQDRRTIADVDVGCVLCPHLSCPERTGAVRHGLADDLFPHRSWKASPPRTSPACSRSPTPRYSTELWRPERRIVVAERAAARDHDADRVFQGVKPVHTNV